MSILTENRSDSFLSSLIEKDLAKKIQVSIKTEDILRKAIKLLCITVYTTEAGFLQSQLIIQFLFVHLKMIEKFSLNRWILIDFDEL
uniref:Uncharacterized protein n=1 Tax=Romanomermis culicivorax TaxID=13658 RepID=A0A915I584_ROMCU